MYFILLIVFKTVFYVLYKAVLETFSHTYCYIIMICCCYIVYVDTNTCPSNVSPRCKGV